MQSERLQSQEFGSGNLGQAGSIAIVCVAVVLSIALFLGNQARGLLIAGGVGLCCLMLLHMQLLIAAQRKTKEQADAILEVDAFRRATLALSDDVRMNKVLGEILEALYSVVPFEGARILLFETETRLFLAREVHAGTEKEFDEFPDTVDASAYLFLKRILASQNGVLVSNTGSEIGWRSIASSDARSWLGVPLSVSGQILGLLVLSHSVGGFFSEKHLKLTASMAYAGAVAVQNARLYERSEIFAAEFEENASRLRKTTMELEYLKRVKKD